MSEYIVKPDEGAECFIARFGLESVSILGYGLTGEIVRCRDCEHARVLHPLNPITGVPVGIEDWRCDYFWNADELPEVEPDGFCAWGERREERDD